MRLISGFIFTIVLAGLSSIASATTVNFDSTECPSCVNTVPVIGNEWSSYGLSVNSAYWYTDSRDTFDRMGLSVAPVSVPSTASIGFSSATDSTGITFDYWVIGGFNGLYQAYDSLNNVLGSINVNASSSDVLGTYTIGGSVSRLDWIGTGGFAQVSTLTYNLAPVPEPETYGMLLAGLGLLGFMARRRNNEGHAA